MNRPTLWMLLTAAALVSTATGAATTDKSETSEDLRWFQIEVIAVKNTDSSNLLDESWDTKSKITFPENLVDFLQPWEDSNTSESSTTESSTTESSTTESSPAVSSTANTNETDSKPAESDTIGNTDQSTGLSPSKKHDLEESAKSLIEAAPNLNQSEQSARENLTASTLDTDGNESNTPKPFELLSKEELELNDEAQILQRDPAYQVLLHIGWRQPVLSEAEAPWIRLAGGYDYHSEYHFDGSKIEIEEPQTDTLSLENLPQDNLSQDQLPLNGQDSQSVDSNTQTETIDQPQGSATETHTEHTATTAILDSTGELTPFKNSEEETATQSKVPAPWVPELDGSIQIYLKRYLHLNTKLWYRRPDKETITLLDLTKSGSEKDSMVPTQSYTNDLLTPVMDNDTAKNLVGASEHGSTPTSSGETTNGGIDNPINSSNLLNDGFNWQIGDDFLNNAPSQSTIERLFNYPIQQTRRMRSKELHYIDHPLVGLLIRITPWDPQADNPDANEEMNSTSHSQTSESGK